ncbi:hypothetical protein BJF79_47195 [Actinomadura sp. CNU-125]|nr:hypothetical protein BJF79_47195 [Actinomadura sp. CNU-125]
MWRGHDELLDRAVAIKELRLPEDLSEDDRVVFYRRTLREARAPAQLRTPSIVEVYDVVIEQGRPWIVMELIEAPSLEELIERSGPLPPDRVGHIGRKLLDALGIAHRAGIVHRDLKPSNVLLDGDRVVLTDFGLAFSSGSASLTKTGHFMGSPAYVAPEVAAGEKATPRSDLWSLGATLYAALEGRPPFERDNVMATLSALANESAQVPANAGTLGPVITGLLEKNPTRRLSHARAADRLERALSGPRSGRRPATPRHRLTVVAALVAATVPSCGVGATALVVGMMREGPSTPSATPPPSTASAAANEARAPGRRRVQHAGRAGQERRLQDLRVGAGRGDAGARRRDARPGRGAQVRPAAAQRGDLRLGGLRGVGERTARGGRFAGRAQELHRDEDHRGLIPAPGM